MEKGYTNKKCNRKAYRSSKRPGNVLFWNTALVASRSQYPSLQKREKTELCCFRPPHWGSLSRCHRNAGYGNLLLLNSHPCLSTQDSLPALPHPLLSDPLLPPLIPPRDLQSWGLGGSQIHVSFQTLPPPLMSKRLSFAKHLDIAVHMHLEHNVSEMEIRSLLTSLAIPPHTHLPLPPPPHPHPPVHIVLPGSSTFPFTKGHSERSLTSSEAVLVSPAPRIRPLDFPSRSICLTSGPCPSGLLPPPRSCSFLPSLSTVAAAL